MASYLDSLSNKKFVPNVVVRLMGQYFSIRQPDSGLVVPDAQKDLLDAITLNPTTIDPFRATTTVNQNSIKILDKNNVVSTMFGSNPQIFQGELLEIWLGRCNEGMDFSDYLKLTNTYVSKVSKPDNAYTFATKEAKDRLSTGAYNDQIKLAVDILDATTVITVLDVTGLATSGLFKIEDEFISYTGIAGNNLTGCIRGEQGSVPVAHSLGTVGYIAQVVQANPITMLLQLLISSGGGGIYDVLPDGAAIDQSLIDITEFESVRDAYFPTRVFKHRIYGLSSFKKFIEDEILYPLDIRLRSNNNGKIGLAVLNRAILNIDSPDLDHDQITKLPKYDVDDTKINNRVRIEYDYNDATGNYLQTYELTDADSIAQFGETPWFSIKAKGIRGDLGGADLVNDMALIFLNRFSYPKPLIGLNTHMSASKWQLGEKPFVSTTTIPNSDGELNFGENIEIIQKAININTGDHTMQLAFTAFTGIRQCFLAPSDTLITVTNQKTVVVGAGRGDQYRAGWKMRLYNNTTRDYADIQVNEIASVVGDTITFVNNWATTLLTTTHRIMFADYDDVTEQQKKFCFVSAGTMEFLDGKKPYQITFG